jgi:hypothetical protein
MLWSIAAGLPSDRFGSGWFCSSDRIAKGIASSTTSSPSVSHLRAALAELARLGARDHLLAERGVHSRLEAAAMVRRLGLEQLAELEVLEVKVPGLPT